MPDSKLRSGVDNALARVLQKTGRGRYEVPDDPLDDPIPSDRCRCGRPKRSYAISCEACTVNLWIQLDEQACEIQGLRVHRILRRCGKQRRKHMRVRES